MSVLLRRSTCSSCLRLEHNIKHTVSSLRCRRSLSTRTSVDTIQPFRAQTVVTRRSTTIGREEVGKRKPRDYLGIEELRPNLLEQTKVQDYLDYVASTNNSVTLEDIERCKPKMRAIPGTPEYAEDYNLLLENLVRSFSKVQLARFLELYSLEPPVKRTKWCYAETIIERQWKWPSLTDIQKRQRDWSEVTYKTFPLNPNEAFLILGKDGINLLSLSRKYNVHVSFSANPLCLRVEGLRGSLDNIGQYIANFRDDVAIETFSLPGGNPPRSELLQRISRITGVLTENVTKNSIRMSYRKVDHQAVSSARKLIMRSMFEPSISTLIETQKLLPGLESNIFHHTYSLYPFLSPRYSPWDAEAGSLFRLRRVGEWFRVNSGGGVLVKSGGTALTMNDDRVDIRDTLLRRSAMSPKNYDIATSHTAVTASFGHVLACTTPSQWAAVVSPQAQGGLSQMLAWAQSQKRIFIPSLPGSVLDSRRSQQRLLHRVLYRVLPGQLEDASPPEPLHSTGFFKAEFHIEMPNFRAQSLSPDADQSVNNPDPSTMIITPKYWTGVDTEIDLMLPDCSMDIRFLASDSTTVADHSSPHSLQAYFRQLQSFLSLTEEGASLPNPPLSFVHQGVTYGLKSTCSVRQSEGSPQSQPLGSANHILPTVSESILDLDSNGKYMTCELACPDITSHESWSLFLHTCDQLIAFTPRPISASNIPDILSS
ncbi:hypothetical protein BDZ94DRAFT_1222387 [Collybia nuda]|uniref:SLS1 C-terminal domain-containing protein n=1 Tax=Collybia nuda TaxID=64659 RepID=A0A9P6CCL5_9AGAR|nr:hypothetical protein BDZ94DRAFT_1222387 [Collybia nuda]